MPYKAVLIELKNIFLYSSMANVQLHANTFKSILYCGATVEYQCGRISEDQYFARLASDFGLQAEQVILLDDDTDNMLAALSMGL